MASNKRCNEEDGERENASANRRSTARSKKRRGGPSLVNFADTLIEFPTLVGPLVEVFTDASRNGPMNVQNLADRVRQISAAGNLYLPTDFSGLSLDVVIDDFQLLYDGNYLGEGKDYVWHTQQIMTGVPKGVKAMIPSHCFVVSAKLAHKYMKRTSESICRCMIDMVLLNVVDELHKEVPGFPLLRISGEVAIKYAHDSSRKMWNGRVDYALGVERGGGAWYQAISICEAKKHGLLALATGQLAGYLAVLRDCRVRLGRKDLEVYGVTTDGINFQFFCLTAVGSLLISPQVSAMDEGGYNNIFLLLGAVIFKSLKQSLLLGASFQDGNTGDPVVHVAEEHFDDDRNTIDG